MYHVLMEDKVVW